MGIESGPTGPDFGAMLALSNFKSGAGSPMLCLLPGSGADVKCFESLSSLGKGFNADATFIKPAQRKGLIAKLLEAMGLTSQKLNEDLSNVAKAAPPQQAAFQQVNNITEITGHGLSGGSFVQAEMGSRGGGDIGLG